MPAAIQQRLLMLQYAVTSILIGMLPLVGIMLSVIKPALPGTGVLDLKPLAIGLVVAAVPIWLLVRMLIHRSVAERPRMDELGETDWQFLIGRYGAICIIGAALLEGAAIFAFILYAFSREPEMLALSIAPAVAILFMFPTVGNFNDFVERVRRPR